MAPGGFPATNRSWEDCGPRVAFTALLVFYRLTSLCGMPRHYKTQRLPNTQNGQAVCNGSICITGESDLRSRR